MVIGGNMRLRALRRLGYTAAPCKVIDPSTDVKKLAAYLIKDNGSFGEWNFGLLEKEWGDFAVGDWGVDFSEDQGPGSSHKIFANTGKNDKRCVLEEAVTIYRKGDLRFLSIYKVTENGELLTDIKTPRYVEKFSLAAHSLIRDLLYLSERDTWCVTSAPRRRHSDWNFAVEVGRHLAGLLHVTYYEDVLVCRNRDRVKEIFDVVGEIKEPNVIIFDDVVTTGYTLVACCEALHAKGKNTLCITGIRN